MSVRALRRGSIAASRAEAVPAGFNPLTALTWHTAAWAEDPLWTPPADGAAVSSWRDGSGNGRTLTQATGAKQPLYRATTAALNGKPAVEFDGVDDAIENDFTPAVAVPFTLVLVAKANTVVNFAYMVQSFNGGMYQATGPNRIGCYNNSVFTSSITLDLAGHLFHVVMNGASTKLGKDGTEQTGNAGSNTGASLSLGSGGGGSAYSAVTIAFAGFYAGNITVDAGWAAFKADIATHYGLTIA